MTYIYLFLQSNILEWPLYLSLLTNVASESSGRWSLARSALFVTIMNSITHPLVFFGFMNLPLPYLANILLAETFAILVETYLVRRFTGLKWATAGAVSLFANLISWQVAPMLTYSLFQSM